MPEKLFIVCYRKAFGDTWETPAEAVYTDYNVAAMFVELRKAQGSRLTYVIFEAAPAVKPEAVNV